MSPRREIPVVVVIPPRVLLLDVAGPIEVLRKANLEQGTVHFSMRYVGPMASVQSSIGLSISGVGPLPEGVPDDAIVVICGSVSDEFEDLAGRRHDEAAENAIIDWLRRSIRPGIRLVSICSGALLAARAGLLDDRDCTTHHGITSTLCKLAPTARVRENRLFVEDGERLTSAGITAGIDLMLHIIAQVAGHACALAVARYLVIYLRRAGSDPQLSPWLEGRNHMHPAIHRAQDAIAADPSRDWSVETLARVAATSRRNLSRLFNEHTGMSVSGYVARIRVALAHDLVIGSRFDIETVAAQSGLHQRVSFAGRGSAFTRCHRADCVRPQKFCKTVGASSDAPASSPFALHHRFYRGSYFRRPAFC